MIIREATVDDLPAVIRLLAEDQLGFHREAVTEPLQAGYLAAWNAIVDDPNHTIVVVEVDGEVIGTMQLSFLPGLSHTGAWRAQLEAVRVAAVHRGHGHGQRMVLWGIERARERGCRIMQLTSNKARAEAHHFYVNLGFQATHEGFKLTLG